MKIDKINKLVNENYKIKVFLAPDKKYTKMLLKTMFFNEDTNIVYPVYYNHVKKLLNDNQLKFIESYNTIKNWAFKDKVDMNIKFKDNKESISDIEKRIVYNAINKMEYIEQI